MQKTLASNRRFLEDLKGLKEEPKLQDDSTLKDSIDEQLKIYGFLDELFQKAIDLIKRDLLK